MRYVSHVLAMNHFSTHYLSSLTPSHPCQLVGVGCDHTFVVDESKPPRYRALMQYVCRYIHMRKLTKPNHVMTKKSNLSAATSSIMRWKILLVWEVGHVCMTPDIYTPRQRMFKFETSMANLPPDDVKKPPSLHLWG